MNNDNLNQDLNQKPKQDYSQYYNQNMNNNTSAAKVDVIGNCKKFIVKNKLIVLIVSIVLILLIALVIFAGINKNHYKIEDIVRVEFSGLNGYGNAKIVETEKNKILQEKLLKGSIKDKEICYFFIGGINFDLSKSTDLKNGEELELSVNYNKSRAKELGVKIKKDKIKIKVKDLEQGNEINPFDELEVSFSGYSGKGKLETKNNSINDFVKNSVRFNAKDSVNGKLKNGDEVVVVATFSKDSANQKKIVLTELEKIYKVQGLSEYVTDFTKLSESQNKTLDELINAKLPTSGDNSSNRVAFRKFSDNASVSGNVNVEIVGIEKSYFLTSKSSNNNIFYNVYKVNLTNGEGVTTTGYYAISANDLVINSDGSLVSSSVKQNSYEKDLTTLTNKILENSNQWNLTEIK